MEEREEARRRRRSGRKVEEEEETELKAGEMLRISSWIRLIRSDFAAENLPLSPGNSSFFSPRKYFKHVPLL